MENGKHKLQKISRAELLRNKFYKMPKWLFVGNFNKLSNNAKILYTLLADRNELSVVNDLVDDEGHVYQYFTRSEAQKMLGVSNKTATNTFQELIKCGLIIDIRQGVNKANMIYLTEPVLSDVADVVEKEENTTKQENKQDAEAQKTTANMDNDPLATSQEPPVSPKKIAKTVTTFETHQEACAFALEYIKEKVVADQQEFINEIVVSNIENLKSLKKVSVRNYVIKVIKQHKQHSATATAVPAVKQDTTTTPKQPKQPKYHKQPNTRAESLPDWDKINKEHEEYIANMPTNEYNEELDRIKQLMAELI